MSTSTAAMLSLPTHTTATIVPSESLSAGLLFSPASEVIPKKLVDKIRSGKFVEMKELLQDNISLATQLKELQGPSPLPVPIFVRSLPSQPGATAFSGMPPP